MPAARATDRAGGRGRRKRAGSEALAAPVGDEDLAASAPPAVAATATAPASDLPPLEWYASLPSAHSDSAKSTDDDSLEAFKVDRATRKRQRNDYLREYYRRHNPFRPVFQCDFRRKLGQMWVNALNWNDPFMLRSFLQAFSARDCPHMNQFPDDFLRVLPTLRARAPMEQTVLHSAYCALTIPDMAVQLKECRVVQTAHQPGSQLVMRVRFLGLSVCEVPSDVLALLQHTVDSHADGAGGGMAAVEADQSPHPDPFGTSAVVRGGGTRPLFSALPELDWSTLRELCVPVHVDRNRVLNAEGDFVFALDEQHRIRSWELRIWRSPLEAAAAAAAAAALALSVVPIMSAAVEELPDDAWLDGHASVASLHA